jgi:hypothetical protein
MALTLSRPGAEEHAPYYGRYIDLVPEGNLVDLLVEQQLETLGMLRRVEEERGTFAYAPGKWTIKEVIGHMSDAERVFSYRALRFARGDATPLASFDENVYAPAGRFNERRMGSLIDEFQSIRAATVHLFRYLSDEELTRRGVASGNPVSVRALGYIIAGHERHHASLLRERYGL